MDRIQEEFERWWEAVEASPIAKELFKSVAFEAFKAGYKTADYPGRWVAIG